ncbi:hypothetical protein DL96DRAFT_1106022 [Flagelloscypha sp. PMI_526]|nr:hypothetical protein DL96DRAFT_1106022 [Flagelloscypha sp. PMI_526]
MLADGHVNISPKGMLGSFHYVDNNTVWYEDLTGSGNETISHIRDNGRITIMFTAFEGPPRILRLFGIGEVYEFGSPEYDQYIPQDKREAGSRAVILINIHKVGTSCGYSVPFFQYKCDRFLLCRNMQSREVASNQGLDVAPDGKPALKAYWAQKNTTSIDGLPGLMDAHLCEDPFLRKLKDYPVDDVRAQKVESSQPREAIQENISTGYSLAIAFLFGSFATVLVQRLAHRIGV